MTKGEGWRRGVARKMTEKTGVEGNLCHPHKYATDNYITVVYQTTVMISINAINFPNYIICEAVPSVTSRISGLYPLDIRYQNNKIRALVFSWKQSTLSHTSIK